MSYVLPKEAKSRKKYNSLPDDLRGIADELIRNKFKEEEEVESPWWGNDFHGPDAFHAVRFNEVFIDPSMAHRQRGYQDDIWVKDEPWSGSRIATLRIREPTFHCMMQANKRFDMENIPGQRKLLVHPKSYSEIRMNEELGMRFQQYNPKTRQEGSKDIAGNIMGMDVLVHPDIDGIMLQAKF